MFRSNFIPHTTKTFHHSPRNALIWNFYWRGFVDREKSHNRKLVSAPQRPHHTTKGAIWGGFYKSLHYLFNFTNFVITFQFISFYCVAKCVVFIKKVTSRKSLKVTYINWLRELDLNQRPSGYEPDELPDCSIPRYLIYFFIM